MKIINLLFIEDDAADFMLAEQVFNKIPGDKKYNIEWQKTYEDGLSAIQEKRHDIYIVDYTLGHNNGLELITKANEMGFDGPFILLTGMDSHYIYDKSADLGVYDYILKNEIAPSSVDRSITYALERRHVEQRLKSQRAFNEFIMQQLPYMVIVIKKGGNISFVNPIACAITGYTEQEILDTHWIFLFPFSDEELLSDKMIDSFENGRGFLAPFVDKAGNEKTISWNIIQHSEIADEENIEFILSGQDVTDELEAESQERQKQKMEALGHLAGGVAHELNNLLQPIILAADIVQGKFAPDEKSYKHLDKVLRSANAAAAIVEDILVFSRQEKKAQELLGVVEVIEETISIVEDQLPKTTTIDISGQKKLGESKITINKHDLVRLMTNLIMNAAHAMDDHGLVSVRLDLLEVTAEDAALNLDPGSYVKIDVIDSGCGIPPEHLDSIFNPFFTTKDVGKGTGLGLAICFNVVQGWGGTIQVKSQMNKGTTFSVLIPRS